MRIARSLGLGASLTLFVAACSNAPTTPSSAAVGAMTRANAAQGANLEVILRGDGFGLVKFRQPKDEEAIVYLDTWVRDLEPNTSYLLQRAVDATVDGDCTSSAWLTLGKGTVPQSILTDENGTGREALFRNLSAVAPGTRFDIHFRVIKAATSAVVLESGCYEFAVTI